MASKFEMNKRQIVKTANQKSLMDAVDNLDTIHQTKGTYNKKILLNVNNFSDKSHKEKQASFYWDYDHVLLIADDVITGRFKETFYNPKTAAVYSQYGGGTVSRVLNIGFKDGKYIFQVALYKPIKTKTGAIMPDKNNPIDNHTIYVGEFETRLFMTALKTHVETKLTAMALQDMGGSGIANTPVKSVDEPEIETPEEPENNGHVGDIDDFLANL